MAHAGSHAGNHPKNNRGWFHALRNDSVQSFKPDPSPVLPAISLHSHGSFASLMLSPSASAPTLGRAPRKGKSKSGGGGPSATFIQRQMEAPGPTRRRQLALLQREVAGNDGAGKGSGYGLEGFLALLRRRHGSVAAGWQILDAERRGQLSLQEFALACRRVDHRGSAKRLWSELGKGPRDRVSILDLDPDAAHYVETFVDALLAEHGDILRAWNEGVDRNQNGIIEEEEVLACCQDLGLALDGTALFATLRGLPPGLQLRLEASGLRVPREADEAFEEEHGERPLAAKQGEEPPKRYAPGLEPRRYKAGLHDLASFKRSVTNRYNSLLGAWRKALDVHDKGRLSYMEFALAMGHADLFGDTKGIFKALDAEGKGFITLRDLDPKADAMLSEMRAKLVEKHGSLLRAWFEAIDVKGDGTVREKQFVKGCAEAGFAEGAAELFGLLLPEKSSFSMKLCDFDRLCDRDFLSGDLRGLAEVKEPHPTAGRKPLDMSFGERNLGTFKDRLNKAWQRASDEEGLAQVCRLKAPAGDAEHQTEDFNDLCKRFYGSMLRAWRLGIDTDCRGKVTFGEFCPRARKNCGYDGELHSLWCQFDGLDKGHITLDDVDAEAYDLSSRFQHLLSGFGDLETAWRKGFKKDPHDSVTEEQFLEACDSLGYDRSAAKLFRMMLAPGKKGLTIYDIDPQSGGKWQRGHHPVMTSPRSSPLKAHHAKKGGAIAGTKETSQAGTSRSRVSNKSQASSLTSNMPKLERLRMSLRQRHGTTATAWRVAMDPGMRGSVSWGNFCLVLEDCLFSGNAKGAWHELCGETGVVTFEDVDPESSAALGGFRAQLLDQFGGLCEAWQRCFDKGNQGHMSGSGFQVACEGLGIPREEAKALFLMLCSHIGQKIVGLTDFRVLLIGVPPEQCHVVWAGPLAEEDGPASGKGIQDENADEREDTYQEDYDAAPSEMRNTQATYQDAFDSEARSELGNTQASATYKSDVDDEASSAQGPSQLGNTQASSAAVAESAAAESAAKSAVSKPSDGASGQKQPGLGDTYEMDAPSEDDGGYSDDAAENAGSGNSDGEP